MCRYSSNSESCAACHPDGASDGRVWDFTHKGEGLRRTISLLGRSGMGHGPLHWSGNFDEVQDFEHEIRIAFSGMGLMAEAEFLAAIQVLIYIGAVAILMMFGIMLTRNIRGDDTTTVPAASPNRCLAMAPDGGPTGAPSHRADGTISARRPFRRRHVHVVAGRRR